MIFQHTYQQVLDGTKTQTRRLVKESNHVPVYCEGSTTRLSGVGRWAPLSSNQWVIYQWAVGHTYAVQPGRGQKAIARIRVTGIRQEDVRQIGIDDVRREGFRSKYEFLETWTMMHDQAAYNARPDGTWLDMMPLAQQQKVWRDWLQSRNDEKYQAWVLEFELVREAVTA